MSGEWVDPLVRGVTALFVASAVYLAARYRFKRREANGDPAGDIGLD